MKLINSQKKKEEKKKEEALYPKVKTFSRTYEYSPSVKTESSEQSGYAPSFYPDERPYPVNPAVSASVPVSAADPERIDLQDTILTDESFVERPAKYRPTVSAVPAPDASVPEQETELHAESGQSEGNAEPDESLETEQPEEAEETTIIMESEAAVDSDESDWLSWSSEPEYVSSEGAESAYPDKEIGSDPFYCQDSEAKNDAGQPAGNDQGSFFVPDDDDNSGLESPLWSEPVTESETEDDSKPEKLYDTEPETDSGSAEMLFPHMETKGKTSLTASWQPVPDADGYDLFFARSGDSFDGVYRTLSPEETAFTFKGLDKKTVYKMRVSAFNLIHGQKTVIRESGSVRCITGGSTKKFTNALEIKTKEDRLELSVNEKNKISASVTGEDSDRKVLAHGSILHYFSSNTSVATVSKEGKICGIAPGCCRIWIIAANGIRSGLDVTVREGSETIVFKKKKYSLEVGKSINLKKTLRPKPDKGSGSLKWKSSDKEIAKVSKKGILTALKKGRIKVRVKGPDIGSAKVRIRISAVKKSDALLWDNFGTEKNTSSDKKWSYFA